MDILPKNFGLPKKLWRVAFRNINKTIAMCGSDLMFNKMPFYSAYRQLYPIRDFDYKFNSWGFRSDYDFEPYRKQKVIIAVGDSFTMNVAGPQEHSWPSLLQEKVNIPVFNCGVDGLGPDSYHHVVDMMRQWCDVQHTFCMYNLHGDSTAVQLADPNTTEAKIHLLTQYEWPVGSEVVFIPPWCWSADQRDILYRYFPDAHAYMKDINLKFSEVPYDIFMFLITPDYLQMANTNWPSLEAIYQQLAMHNHLGDLLSDVDAHFFLKLVAPKCKSYFYRSRDFRHMSKMTNQMVADYFYSKISEDVINLS